MSLRRKILLRRRRRQNIGGGFTYLLRDLFSPDEAAPIATPANVDVGIRTVLADTGSDAAISGGKLSLTNAGASWTATVLQWAQAGDEGWTRAAGLCLAADVELGNAAAKFIIGWDDTATASYPRDGAIYFTGGGNGVCIVSSEAALKILIPTTGVVYRLYIVLRDTGYLYFIKEGSADPYLLWSTVGAFDPTGSATEATPKVKMSTNSNAWTMDNLKIVQLPAPFNTDFGIATLNIASPADATDYTATADQELSLTLTAPGSITEEAGIIYRKLDADNYWRAYFDTAGAFKVDSVSAGTPTNRINVAGVITGGATLTIRVLTNGSLHDAFTLLDTVPTKRGAQVNVSHQNTIQTVQPDIGTGWTAANLRSFPRAAYNLLNTI